MQRIRGLVYLVGDGGGVHGADVNQDFIHQRHCWLGRLIEQDDDGS